MKEARAEGLRCWAEQPGQGVQSKHGGWFPKVYAEQLEKKREGLKKRLSMVGLSWCSLAPAGCCSIAVMPLSVYMLATCLRAA